jgi:hypothetical protein
MAASHHTESAIGVDMSSLLSLVAPRDQESPESDEGMQWHHQQRSMLDPRASADDKASLRDAMTLFAKPVMDVLVTLYF